MLRKSLKITKVLTCDRLCGMLGLQIPELEINKYCFSKSQTEKKKYGPFLNN